MRVIITGAAGQIGNEIVEELAGTHELCLIDRFPVEGHPTIIADLASSHQRPLFMPWSKSKPSRWTEGFRGAEVVLHLAANPRSRASWQQVARDNVQATWNVLEAAARHSVDRVVFASSNAAVRATERQLAPDCYTPRGPKIGSPSPPRPITPYGFSKAAGELAGQMLVDEGKLRSFVAVRIGAFRTTWPEGRAKPPRWIGTDDLRGLLQQCIEVEFEGFHVVYGVSAQQTAPYDLSHTRSLLRWEPRQMP